MNTTATHQTVGDLTGDTTVDIAETAALGEHRWIMTGNGDDSARPDTDLVGCVDVFHAVLLGNNRQGNAAVAS